mgnify:CR=1 FL=1
MEEQIKAKLKTSQFSQDELTTSVLRMLLSEIHNGTIAKNAPLDDSEIVAVVQKELKKRREAVEAYTKGGRSEAAQKEQAEAKILEEFLPAQLSDEQLTEMVNQAITTVGATSITDMGKVMELLKEQVGTQAEPARISMMVKEKLNG